MFNCGAALVLLTDVEADFRGPGKSNLYRCFSRREMACCGGGSTARPLERLAGRLAAKRAVLRALGLPADDSGLWPAVEILPGPAGAPRVCLPVGLAAAGIGEGVEVQVSISHGNRAAVAMAVIVRRTLPGGRP